MRLEFFLLLFVSSPPASLSLSPELDSKKKPLTHQLVPRHVRQRPGRRPSAVPLPRQHPRRPGVRRRVSADGPAERLGQQGLLEVVAPALVVEGGEEEAVELEEVAWALGGLGDAVGTSAGGRSGGESRCRRGGAAAVCVGNVVVTVGA